MHALGSTLQGSRFDHLLYPLGLPYSTGATGVICFSESFESLSAGLQTALGSLGGVPHYHQTDRRSAAVPQAGHPAVFTQRYQAWLRPYGLVGRKTNAASPHENGAVEQRHHRFKRALEQALWLRGSPDFNTREDDAAFVEQLFHQRNSTRRERFREEQAPLRPLPDRRLETANRLTVRVGPSSTIRVSHTV